MLEDSSNLQSIKNNLKILNYFLHKNGLPIAEDYKIDTGLMETTILIPVFRGRDTTAGFIIDRIDLKLIFYHTTISDHVGRYIMDIHQLSNQR
ncbi:hypothetical protein EDB95_5485 [Dinghuibacter silviterrae]|uniref:Uncharacterized protein n=2 Tax=Dinghuibacter silviterrae TaxID=1539049 RepID=A0A4R8DJX9_9BACT|nr:hypothetical protein EDB95_5485 [Dinghuibacter silviterrae]